MHVRPTIQNLHERVELYAQMNMIQEQSVYKWHPEHLGIYTNTLPFTRMPAHIHSDAKILLNIFLSRQHNNEGKVGCIQYILQFSVVLQGWFFLFWRGFSSCFFFNFLVFLYFCVFFCVTRVFFLVFSLLLLKKILDFFSGVFLDANLFRIRRIEGETKKYFQPKKVIIQKKQTIIIGKSQRTNETILRH